MVIVKVVAVTVYVPVSVLGYVVPVGGQLSVVVTIVRLLPLVDVVPLAVHAAPVVGVAVYDQVPSAFITRVMVYPLGAAPLLVVSPHVPAKGLEVPLGLVGLSELLLHPKNIAKITAIITNVSFFILYILLMISFLNI